MCWFDIIYGRILSRMRLWKREDWVEVKRIFFKSAEYLFWAGNSALCVFRCKTSHNGFSLDTAEVFSVPMDSEIVN